MEPEPEYREYRLHIVANGRTTTKVYREWLHPKTNKQRQDNAVVEKNRAKLTPLPAKQRRARVRRAHKAFRIRQFKKQNRAKES
jgi:hypothetical protein